MNYCSVCKHGVADYVIDPYIHDLYGEIEMVWLCVSCYNEKVWDI